jgi:hypothetical protein
MQSLPQQIFIEQQHVLGSVFGVLDTPARKQHTSYYWSIYSSEKEAFCNTAKAICWVVVDYRVEKRRKVQ